VTALLTLALGALTAFATAWLPPARAMATAALLLVGYVILNGTLLFDRFGLIVGLAAPMVAVPLVWGACVLLRMAVETRERALITRRFQAYVDPTLVDYVLEHPDQVQLRGQVKELTVVFTDLANFTTLSEALGERSVALLNEYMAEMVPIIRRHRGYVNKFLGDGIMCFYGAPRDNADHAIDAMRSALEMQVAIGRFNARHARGDLPPLNVRVGISTGPMVVGDAGSSDCSDYTVLGDAVNLGARLESANKHLGTNVLVTSRTVELARDLFGFRPVGTLRVAGKNEGVEVFEAVGPAEPTARAERRTQLTVEMVAAYRRGDFLDSVMAAEALDRETGVTRLAALYRERSEAYLRYGKPDDFDGSIALNTK
jgi:adenylate cyclase